MRKKHALDCYCDDCHERDYWQRHTPGTHCACIDCCERWGLPDPPPRVTSLREPFPVMYFPTRSEVEDE